MVSVIIPAYNAEKSIEETVNSVLKQTYQDIEIIIVDDGSTDRTGEISERVSIESGGIVRTIHTQNKGVVEARMCGFSVSKGKWISFVDSDDTIDSRYIEVLEKAGEEADADIVMCGYSIIYPDDSKRKMPIHKNYGELYIQECMGDLISGIISPSLWDKLYRSNVFCDLIKNKEIVSPFKINEDLLMNFFMFQNARRCISVDECLYNWKVNPGSATRSGLTESKIYDPINAKKVIMDLVDESLRNIAQRRYICTLINTYGSIAARGITKYSKDEEKVRYLLREQITNIRLLPRKKQFQGYAILTLHKLYSELYRYYCRKIQKSFTEYLPDT